MDNNTLAALVNLYFFLYILSYSMIVIVNL